MPARLRQALLRSIGGLLGLLLVAGALELVRPPVAHAALPDAPAPETVTADPLPTVQINGVAWAQAVVGDTVYVAGSFTRARPAGAAAGTSEVVRNNLLAYDIRTGELITSFAPNLNGQARAIVASPDGSRIYVGGDFTQANGQPRSRIAAYSTATGQLVPDFRPAVNGTVRALAASSGVVYLGGDFTAVGGTSRTKAAAVSAVDGALQRWAPRPGVGSTAGNWLPNDPRTNSTTSNTVLAMVLTGNDSQVVLAGRFDSLNGVKATGVGAVDATTHATRTFAINRLISNQGINSAIWSLSTDGTNVYGTGYDYYGPGNLESAFAARADGGALVWVSDCRGDTYASFPMGGALYTASHAHDCANIGSFPEQTPTRVHMYANAFSLSPTGVNQQISGRRGNDNFVGTASPSRLAWAPTFYSGSYTGQQQAGWTVTGNDRYVLYGGEFPGVNGSNQQGLVRFAVRALARNKVAPRATSAFTPTVTMLDGSVRISWKTVSDRDDHALTYRVYRDSDTSTPVCQVTRTSEWWLMPVAACEDVDATVGAHRYLVTATDSTGNRLASTWAAATVPASATGDEVRPYATVVAADGASSYWPLGETAGPGFDHDGTADLTVGTGVARNQAGALSGDPDRAYSFDGTANGVAATRTLVPGPQTFSLEAWFQTTSTRGGRIIGFGNQPTGASTRYDRMIWMDPAGKVNFGIFTGVQTKLTSTAAFNDGTWHQVVATMDSSRISLYVDGVRVAWLANTKWAQRYDGYWRIGGGDVWANSGSPNFAGRIDEVSVYPTALSAEQVADHLGVARSGVLPNVAPTPAFTAAVTHLDVAFDAGSSTDPDGTIASYEWTFGDGTSGTGVNPQHSYASAGTWPVSLTVTDDDGATATRTSTVTTTNMPANVPPTAAFTATAAGRTVSFDGGGSADGDGTVTDYTWSFGDGTTGTGRTASHTYAADGSYPVTLTVTDDRGGTATVEKAVEVSGALIASDSFSRAVTGGLGAADAGGTWTASAGPARQSVASGTAVFAMTPGTNTGSYLGAVAQTDADLELTVSLSARPTGGGANLYVTGRRVGANQEYRARMRVLADGRVALGITRLAGSTTETVIGGEVVVPDLVYTAGGVLHVRLVVSGTGTTHLAASVWADGAAEPAVPTVSRTDTTASLQAPGAVGATGYLSGTATGGVTMRIDDLVVRPVA